MRQPSSKCCGLQTLKWTNGATIQAVEWSADHKSLFINGWERGAKSGSIWRENVEGSEPEKLTENCGFAFDASSDGKISAEFDRWRGHHLHWPIDRALGWCLMQ
jgi:hypothetical protein